MAIQGIVQPDILQIEENLRLRKYAGDHAFALDWYQDAETLLLVDGQNIPYDAERLSRMYHYLEARGELYFIEVRSPDGCGYEPIGDVTFWQQDMPIVIGNKQWRGRGIGRKVILALTERARMLGWSSLTVAEIYDYNTGSKRAFEHAGFRPGKKTEKGHSYTLAL